mmetsp:Transcript_30968/g.61725  ORF Transcript_30968/g.61725 Transcript_30968/m.61725 type:complete len:302 (+) Transcript_30968:270-1175(+)|eukprot:CAMPEP_0171350752 /NCGR_PEP_ID=MMETSP0878-20121228/37171_1 /TAXON_ID=67004 /ORGANISM="Thalassiosira weissflogii, Strain CCMP1336" /LENGTH=301 /DNA_ID=CAMNT_0011855759 /DNA_START=181 /DNA_END=1086 /DNA_ORIENTATION=+
MTTARSLISAFFSFALLDAFIGNTLPKMSHVEALAVSIGRGRNSRRHRPLPPFFGNDSFHPGSIFPSTQYAKTRSHDRSKYLTSMGAASIPSIATALEELNYFYQTFPVASAFITCGIKASAADIVAQKAEATHVPDETTDSTPSTKHCTEEAEGVQIEARRNFSYILYGGIYQGICQHIIFNEIFPLIFGDGRDIITVASKVLFDSLVISPFICLPVAYLVKSMVYQFTIQEAMHRYRADVTENGLLFKYWKIWVPAQCLTFGVIPQHLRIAFIASVSFFWLVVFSSITSQNEVEAEVVE